MFSDSQIPGSAVRKTFFSESWLLLALATPLMLSGFVETSIGFFSNLFLAHLGTESLAAGALVNWVFTTIMVIVWGIFSAITTLVSRHYGAENHAAIPAVLYAGLLLAVLIMPPAIVLLWNLAPIFLFFGQKANTVLLITPYLHGLSWAIIPDFMITVWLQFAAGLGRTKTNLAFSLLLVPISIFINCSLIFGRFGFPALGIAGIGWGTALSYWIITLLFAFYVSFNQHYRPYLTLPALHKITAAMKDIVQLGLPLGLMYCVEVGFFLMMSIMMGLISPDTLSANQVALQFFWLFSIVTFALAQGITIQVGHSIGKNDRKAVDYATYLGVFYSFFFMLIIAILYWRFPKELIRIDFDPSNPTNATVILLAKNFLALAALVQIIEAIRFAFFGALRGLQDTQFTLLTSILIFWIIALPLGYLTLMYNSRADGIWWALVLGEIIGTLLLIWRYHCKVQYCFVLGRTDYIEGSKPYG